MRRVALLLLCGYAASCAGARAPAANPSPALPSAVGSPAPVTFPSERVTVRFGEGAEVRAEVAVTAPQLARGLMYREKLGTDDGMLFLLQTLDADGFYMKNTLIPLSIAYMRRTANRTYQVLAILDMEPCPPATVKCPTYPPGTYYDATVEVNKGWFARNGVKPGAVADVTGPIPNPFDHPTPTP
jgi:uncharacterized membrane protein (UPF0127 family)